jgi:hypothetical protein
MALGEWNVDEMLDGMSATLMDEWKAFYSLEPFGAFQDEFRAGMVTSMIANTARDDKEHPKPFQATEFMREMFTEEIDKTADPEERLKKMSNIFSSFGAKRLPGT